jgi:hypothetical protein
MALPEYKYKSKAPLQPTNSKIQHFNTTFIA